MSRNVVSKLYQLFRLPRRVDGLIDRVDKIQQAIGRVESRQLRSVAERIPLHHFGFQVYSQWDEDGIIQHLISQVEMTNTVFVEFGVENYIESNTRFLLQNNNWQGLVLDGSAGHIDFIRQDPIYWRHNLKAECVFIDASNINEILARNGIQGDIGLLSIDIDGNDYWVWKAIDVIQPRIVITEYNGLFGVHRKVTVPYDPAFQRATAHYSNLYYGCSLAAMVDLANSRNYSLVGTNHVGSNAFFVRNDVLGSLTSCRIEDAFIPVQFRESRDEMGYLNFLDYTNALKSIGNMPLYDIDTGKNVKVSDLK